jgi:hypothetical protein
MQKQYTNNIDCPVTDPGIHIQIDGTLHNEDTFSNPAETHPGPRQILLM